MTTVDNRVVEMGFDNSKFAAGVQGTVSMLEKLKAALGLGGASKGLQDVNRAAQTFDPNPMVQGAGMIGGAFSSMQAVAFGALANIGAKISDTAISMGKAFTIDPIMQGFEEYETNMNSVQTILANTQAAGTNLGQVNHALDELNHYSDQTIYNFSEMARNIGTFTAAGVDLDTATGAIKGIANLAALSGSNSQQAAGAMYQLSQAISAGKVSLMDWNSVVNAGMGGTVFQRALAQTAVNMGKMDESALKLKGSMKNVVIDGKSFRESIDASTGSGWLTSDVLTQTLQQFTGDLTDAELAAEGYSKAQIKAIQKTARTAYLAATEVKTFSGLMGALKESVASGWASSFRIIIGDFEEAKQLFTAINRTVSDFFGNQAKARNALLQSWSDMGGRTELIAGLSAGFKALFGVIKPVIEAFRMIFPKTTARDLVNATDAFTRFMQSLAVGKETARNLKMTFAGFFAILGIGWEVLKAVVGFLFDLFGVVSMGDSGFLKTTAGIAEFFIALHRAIKEGQGLTNFFDTVIDKIRPIVRGLKRITSGLGDLFGGMGSALGPVGRGLGEAISGLLSFGSAAEGTAGVGQKVIGFFDKLFSAFAKIGKAVADFVEPVTTIIGDALSNINYDDLMKGLQTGALAGIAFFLKNIGNMFKGFSLFQNDNNFFNTIKEGFSNLTGSLQAMQMSLKASTLIKIAAAVALLAISVVLLAGVDAAGLARATAALTVMFIQLGVAMNIFQKIGTVGSIVKLNLMGAALILLGVAVLVLAAAMRVLSKMSWEEMGKGMAALAGIITVLIIASRGIDKQKGAILRASVSLILLGEAIKNLIDPIKELGNMDWDVMKQGLIGVGGLLAGLAIFTRLASANKSGLAQSVGIYILAMALKDLGNAVERFGEMKVQTIQRGFAAIGGGLTVIGIALRFMPKSPMVILTALALGKVAASLIDMATAFEKMEDISWDSIKKGMVAMTGIFVLITAAIAVGKRVNPVQSAALYVVASAVAMLGKTLMTLSTLNYEEIKRGLLGMGGALGIMAIAMRLMGDSGTIAGATAMMAMAFALQVLIPMIILLGNTPIAVIALGLGALAAVFVVLGLAAYFLAPAVPVLHGLGIAMLLIGAGAALAGAGVFLFAIGLGALAAAGAAGTAALVAMVSGLLGLIPMVATQIGKGIVALVKTIADSAVELTVAFVRIVAALLDGIIILIPKLLRTLGVLIIAGLAFLVQMVPRFVDAGLKLLIGLLAGIAQNMGMLVTVVVSIVVNFINALANNLPRIIEAGINFIISFVNGLAEGIRNNAAKMGEAGGNLATAIIEGMVEGILGGIGAVVDAAQRMAGAALDAAMEWLGIASPSKKFKELGKFTGQGFAIGLKGSNADIKEAMADMFALMKEAMDKNVETYKKNQAKIKSLREKNAKINRTLGDVRSDIAARRREGKDVTSLVRRERELLKQRQKNSAEIRNQRKGMRTAERENERIARARKHINRQFDDERARLHKLAKQHDVVKKKIEDATAALKDAKQTRDDYRASLFEQFGNLPEVEADTKLKDYVGDLQKQIIETQKFGVAIQELRKRGLNDEMYQDLLAKGPDVLPFLQQLLDGGRAAVNEINYLGTSLDKEADKIGYKASQNMYQAGVDAATGILKGLQAQEAEIVKVMDRIADKMVNAIKTKLGIASPSKVLTKMGEFTGQGFANGLDHTLAQVGRAGENLGDKAVDGLRSTLSNVTTMMGADMDLTPVIAPVLDLSNVQRGAGQIEGLLGTNPLSVGATYSGAASASMQHAANRAATLEAGETVSETIVFEQNNYSPKALSAIEVYRQTNNQLSVARGALTNRAR